MGRDALTHLQGGDEVRQDLGLQGVEVKAAVFKADPCVPSLSLHVVDGEDKASLCQAPGMLC